jgi:hypothetical protein
MIRNRNIKSLRREHWIPWTKFHYATTWAGMDTGAPVAVEVSTFGIGASAVRSGHKWAMYDLFIPRNADVRKPIGFRVVWAPLQNTIFSTDDVHWVVLYDQWDFGEAMIAPATALNTAITLQRLAGTTLYVPHRTKRGIINANSLDFTARQGGLSFSVEASATGFDFANDEIGFMGVLIDYMPLDCVNEKENENVFADLDET